MSANERQVVVALEDCPARRVPDGTPLTIPKDTFLTVSQALGGNYTLIYQGNMVRVDGSDAAALGLEALELNFLPPADDKIDPDQVGEALGTIYDPEIPVDLVNLGLIYDTQIDQTAGVVTITMTLTEIGRASCRESVEISVLGSDRN